MLVRLVSVVGPFRPTCHLIPLGDFTTFRGIGFSIFATMSTRLHSIKLILLMSFFGSLFGCNSNKEISKGSASSGPLQITWSVIQSNSGAWFNNGGNPNAKVYTSYFNISCNGTVSYTHLTLPTSDLV